MSKYTLVLDSSQISTFLECPMMWNYKFRECFGYPMDEEKQAMNAGTYGHQVLDIYYTLRAKGVQFNDAFAEALAFDPDTDFKCKCGHIKKEHTRNIPAFGIGPAGCSRCIDHSICKNFDPQPFELSQDLRFAVKSRLRDYFFTYQNNDFQPNNADAVEVGFSQPVFEDSENLFVLEGRIDLIGTLQGLPTIVDHKFQMRKRDLYKKSVQFRNYDLVCGGVSNMLIINYIRLAKTVDKTTLVREPVCFNSLERAWWKSELIKIFFEIKRQHTETGFLRNYGACAGRYGYPCMYTPLCEEINEGTRELKKSQLFVIRDAWKPW
jgi:hypothetical protein